MDELTLGSRTQRLPVLVNVKTYLDRGSNEVAKNEEKLRSETKDDYKSAYMPQQKLKPWCKEWSINNNSVTSLIRSIPHLQNEVNAE